MTDTLYLDSYLEPLAPFLARDDVTDIYVNRPGEIWIETLGAPPERYDVPSLAADVLLRLARQIAAMSAQGINRAHPLLAASLPGGERVQVAIAPATRGEIALAIRKHVSAGMALEDYDRTGAFGETALISSDPQELVKPVMASSGDPVALLRTAVRERRNILISGGTSSGKTTLLNALLREIPSDERLIFIEDTPELQITHANAVGLLAARGSLGEADIGVEDLLITSLRMRPDRIILGEIRGNEAMTFLRAINTGHPGSLSTIHADSTARAIDQLALLVLQTGTRMAWDDVVTYVRRSLDIIVQLKRDRGRRQIGEIMTCHY